MTKVALAAYRFFQKRRAVFYLLLIGSFVLLALLASRMYYEEDISKLLPQTEENKGARFAFDRLKVKDKIFLEFRLSSNAQMDDYERNGRILAACKDFCDSLLSHDGEKDIEGIFKNVDPELLPAAASLILDNAPLFLDSTFYSKAGSLESRHSVDSLMASNVSLLENDATGFYYDIVCKDPLAFRNIMIGEALSLKDSSDNGLSISASNSFYLFSKDGEMAFAFLTPSFKAMDSKAGTRLVNKINAEIKRFETLHPDVEILYYGAPVQSVYNAKRIKKDLIYTVSCALIIILLIIGFCFRTKDTVFYLLLPLLYGVVFAVAIVYLIQGQMSFIALGIGCIVVGVALSYCIHIITHHKYIADVERVIREQAKPVTLGCITTVGSLLGLIFTRSSLLRDFGITASLVMIGTTLFALFFLPQFFSGKPSKKNEKAFATIEKITTYPYWKKGWLVCVALILFVASAIYTRGRAHFDEDLHHIGYYEPRVMKADSLYRAKIDGGCRTRYFAAFSKDLDSALLLNSLLNEECKKLKSDGKIYSFTNLSSLLVAKGEQEARIERWKNYFTPERRNSLIKTTKAAAEKNGLEPEMFEPFYEALNKEYMPVDICHSSVIPEEIMCNFIEQREDGTYLVFTNVKTTDMETLEEVSSLLASKAELKEGLLVVDPFFYTTDMLAIMNHDFNTVLIISSLFVLLILLIAFRNIIHAIIAFLPMFMSWYIVLGVMAVLNIEFNLINIVISTFIFGMGVDYSIFVMDGLIRGEGGGELIRYHRTAIFFSAVMLILAIGSLMFAVHPAIHSIGFSTLIGMASTILITFTLQPYLYYKLQRFKAKKQ